MLWNKLCYVCRDLPYRTFHFLKLTSQEHNGQRDHTHRADATTQFDGVKITRALIIRGNNISSRIWGIVETKEQRMIWLFIHILTQLTVCETS